MRTKITSLSLLLRVNRWVKFRLSSSPMACVHNCEIGLFGCPDDGEQGRCLVTLFVAARRRACVDPSSGVQGRCGRRRLASEWPRCTRLGNRHVVRKHAGRCPELPCTPIVRGVGGQHDVDQSCFRTGTPAASRIRITEVFRCIVGEPQVLAQSSLCGHGGCRARIGAAAWNGSKHGVAGCSIADRSHRTCEGERSGSWPPFAPGRAESADCLLSTRGEWAGEDVVDKKRRLGVGIRIFRPVCTRRVVGATAGDECDLWRGLWSTGMRASF